MCQSSSGHHTARSDTPIDFCFMGDEAKGKDGTKAEETMPVLVVREVKSKMTLSTAVPSKSTGTFVARPMVGFLCEKCDVVAKSDQEPAITSIVSEVERWRQVHGRVQQVGSSGSNGVVEKAIRSVEQQVRVMKDVLEHGTGMQLTLKHPLMTWITEYAGHLLNRFQVGHDGKTAFERCKGEWAKTLGIEFGGAILWKQKALGGVFAKMTCLWEDGVYLGVRGASREIIVTRTAWKTRSVQRKPEPAMGVGGLGGGQAHAVESARQRPQSGRGEAGG